jgi:hypothetical protein
LVGRKEEHPVPGNPRIRASDADRDRAAALLSAHHAAGRLTAEEFHERLDQALNAKTLGEIDELLADLPVIDLYELPDASLRRSPPRRGQSLLPADDDGAAPRRRWPGPYGRAGFPPGTVAVAAWAAVTALLVYIWAVVAVAGGGTWFPWWVLISAPWIWILIRRGHRGRE